MVSLTLMVVLVMIPFVIITISKIIGYRTSSLPAIVSMFVVLGVTVAILPHMLELLNGANMIYFNQSINQATPDYTTPQSSEPMTEEPISTNTNITITMPEEIPIEDIEDLSILEDGW